MVGGSLAIPEVVMLVGSGASAACCVAPTARASWLARGVAVAMAAMMAAAVFVAAAAATYVTAALLVILALWLLVPVTGQSWRTEWHRAGGALLMAAMMLVHHHLAGMSTAGVTASTGGHHGATHGHSPTATGHAEFHQFLVGALVVAGVGYLAVTAYALLADRDRSGWPRRLAVAEHLTMAIAMAAMTWMLLPAS